MSISLKLPCLLLGVLLSGLYGNLTDGYTKIPKQMTLHALFLLGAKTNEVPAFEGTTKKGPSISITATSAPKAQTGKGLSITATSTYQRPLVFILTATEVICWKKWYHVTCLNMTLFFFILSSILLFLLNRKYFFWRNELTADGWEIHVYTAIKRILRYSGKSPSANALRRMFNNDVTVDMKLIKKNHWSVRCSPANPHCPTNAKQ